MSLISESLPLLLNDKDSIVSLAFLFRYMLMEPLVLTRFTVDWSGFIALALISAEVLDLILAFAFTHWDLVIFLKVMGECHLSG